MAGVIAAFGQDMNVMSVIYVLLIVYGAYSMVNVNKMKRDHEISQWLVSAQDLPRVRDPEGFCNMMGAPTAVFGIGCMAFGVLSLLNTYYVQSQIMHFVMLLAFLVCIIWYVTRLRSAKRTYIY